MKRILAPILLLTLLFPPLALGEEVKIEDLVKRDGLYYPKFSEVPFTGKVTGNYQGKIKDGKRHGPWVKYHENGQLSAKGTFKDGGRDGPWVWYNEDGTVDEEYTGPFKDGVKVE